MSRVQRNVIFTYKIFLEYFQLQQLDTDFIQSKPGVISVSFAKDSALAQLGPNCCSWFHHISKSQNKISRTWVWKFLLLLFLIYSSHLQNSKQNCKCLCVKNCGPKCIEKTTPYIYSIFKMTRNFLLNHLWWWIYVRFENCEIPIDSQSVVPQPSPPAKWRFDWEIGRIWDILAFPCTKMSYSSFHNFIAFDLFGPPPKQCSNYPPF